MTQANRQIFRWLLVSTAIIVAVLAIIFVSKPANTTGTIDGLVLDREWIKGNPEASIVIVEYSDFQCPACANYETVLKDVLSEFNNHVKFVYRHFPLRSIHANAQISAQAAEAAGAQGKFWEMHNKLFEEQGTWSAMSRPQVEKTFIGYAEELGLNVDEFEVALNSSEVEKAVNEDYDSGMAANVNSTPSFFLNGEKINNPRSVEEFRTLIRETIENNS